jgi:hypothetical protein
VEGAGVAGHPLRDDLGVFVYEDAHIVLRSVGERFEGVDDSNCAVTLTIVEVFGIQ